MRLRAQTISIRDWKVHENVSANWVKTGNQLADIFTKSRVCPFTILDMIKSG